MDIDKSKPMEPDFNKWVVTNKIGNGLFGEMYDASLRTNPDKMYTLQIISVPENRVNYERFAEKNPQMNTENIREYYAGIVREYIELFKKMAHIKADVMVDYIDYEIYEKKDYAGFDIVIISEKLIPIAEYFKNTYTRRAVIELGIDICKALEILHEHNIALKTLCPDNIFVSDNGKYKLGNWYDVSAEGKNITLKCPENNMYKSPEVFSKKGYNTTSPLYSLGIIMYKLMNNNMEPFRKYKGFEDEEKALDMRMCAAKISAPVNADAHLSEIILKSCEFDVSNRFHSEVDMRNKLISLMEGTYVTSSGKHPTRGKPSTGGSSTRGVSKGRSGVSKSATKKEIPPEAPPKRNYKIPLIVSASAVAVILVTVLVSFAVVNNGRNKLYIKAQRELKNNDFDGARSIFVELENYKNSSEMITKCDYKEAEFYLKNKEYDKAIEIFEALADKNYYDAAQRADECLLLKSEDYIANNENEKALEILNLLVEKGNKKAKAVIDDIRYDTAIALYDEDKFEEAKKLFEDMEDQNMVTECNYRIALREKANGNYALAMETFAKLGDYADSQLQFQSAESGLTYKNECEEIFSGYDNFNGRYSDDEGNFVEYDYEKNGNENTRYNLTHDKSRHFKVDDGGVHYHKLEDGIWKKQWIIQRNSETEFAVYNYLDGKLYILRLEQ